MKLIGLSGAAGVGKDTVADYLASQYGLSQYAFAAPIKEGLKAMFGLTDQHFTHGLKEAPVEHLGVSPRVLAQRLGTEYGREMVCPDVWIREAERRWLALQDGASGGMVISDVRFDNEADWVRRRGGQVWHIWRPDAKPVARHKSEDGVQIVKEQDILLLNNGTLDDLYEIVRGVLKLESH